MHKEFCEELRLQFDRHNAAVESLEKKAKDLITVSGIIATLLMGFGKFIFENNTSQNTQNIALGVFLLCMVLLLTTVGLCLWANRVEFQKNPFLGKKLLINDKLDPVTYSSWVKSTSNIYYESLAEEYALCLKEAEIVIDRKAFRLTLANFIFPIAVITIPIIMVSAKWDLFYNFFSGISSIL